MHNWSTDTAALKKERSGWSIWKLEQAINFGLCGKRLKSTELKKHWSKLKIDPAKKRFLKFLLWPKQS